MSPSRPTSWSVQMCGWLRLRDRPRLALEALRALRASAARCGGQHLDRDGALEPRVARLVDLAHPARAERREDLVGAEPGPGGEGHRRKVAGGIVARKRRTGGPRQESHAGGHLDPALLGPIRLSAALFVDSARVLGSVRPRLSVGWRTQSPYWPTSPSGRVRPEATGTTGATPMPASTKARGARQVLRIQGIGGAERLDGKPARAPFCRRLMSPPPVVAAGCTGSTLRRGRPWSPPVVDYCPCRMRRLQGGCRWHAARRRGSKGATPGLERE